MTTINAPKRLSTATIDRAAGVLLGQAVGDALGVPYEFGTPPRPGELERADPIACDCRVVVTKTVARDDFLDAFLGAP